MRRVPGVHIKVHILPTEWKSAPQELDRLLEEVRPDIAVHFGVSSRARGFEIETRARNFCALAPDAAGELPASPFLDAGGPANCMKVSLPVAHLVWQLRRRSIPAFVSRDAGAYLCNATLYHALVRARQASGRRVGFIHIPATLARPGGANRGRSGACPLTWAQALEGGLQILLTCLSRHTNQPVMRTAHSPLSPC
jgi:pyroglutamyl-peptidase